MVFEKYKKRCVIFATIKTIQTAENVF